MPHKTTTIKEDLSRACSVFVGILLVGCAVAFIATWSDNSASENLKSDKSLPVGASHLSPGSEANSTLQNGDNALSVTLAEDPTITSDPAYVSRKDEDGSYDREQIAEATPEVPQTEPATLSETDSESAPEEIPAFLQPLVFAENAPDPAANPEEVTEINALRQEFIEQIGGYDEDPSDPQYRERWQRAKQLLDESLRTELGEEVFSRLQNESVTGVTAEVSPD